MDNAEVVVPIHVVENEPEEDFSYLIGEFGLTENPAKASWLCFGGGSRNFVHLLFDMLDPEMHKYTRILGANTDVQQFVRMLSAKKSADRPRYFSGWAKSVKDNNFKLIQLGDEGGAGGRPEAAEAHTKTKEPEIRRMFEDSRISILVANLGGGTGSGAAPEVARMLSERKEEMGSMAVLMTPFGYEGEARFACAERAHKAVTEHIAALTLRNQALYEIGPESRYKKLVGDLSEADTGKAITIMNKYALEPIMRALDQLIMFAASSINRDPADFKRLVQSGKALYVGSYNSDDEGAPEDPDGIVDELLNNPFLAKGIVKNSKLGMVLFRGFQHADAGHIADRISLEMKNGDPGKSIELIPGHDNGEEGRRSIFFIAVAEEELDFDSIRKGVELEQPAPVRPTIKATAGKISVKDPTKVHATHPPQQFRKVKVGIRRPYNEVETQEFELPEELARELIDFQATHLGSPLNVRSEAWDHLRKEVKPYLNGHEMAALFGMGFMSDKCVEVRWHVTPLMHQRYKNLERRCKNREGSKEEAWAEFLALSEAWKMETGHGLHVSTSKILQSAFDVRQSETFWQKMTKGITRSSTQT